MAGCLRQMMPSGLRRYETRRAGLPNSSVARGRRLMSRPRVLPGSAGPGIGIFRSLAFTHQVGHTGGVRSMSPMASPGKRCASVCPSSAFAGEHGPSRSRSDAIALEL